MKTLLTPIPLFLTLLSGIAWADFSIPPLEEKAPNEVFFRASVLRVVGGEDESFPRKMFDEALELVRALTPRNLPKQNALTRVVIINTVSTDPIIPEVIPGAEEIAHFNQILSQSTPTPTNGTLTLFVYWDRLEQDRNAFFAELTLALARFFYSVLPRTAHPQPGPTLSHRDAGRLQLEDLGIGHNFLIRLTESPLFRELVLERRRTFLRLEQGARRRLACQVALGTTG